MDWVDPSAEATNPSVIDTCLIVSESKNHADGAVGFILNVVRFVGDSLEHSKIY